MGGRVDLPRDDAPLHVLAQPVGEVVEHGPQVRIGDCRDEEDVVGLVQVDGDRGDDVSGADRVLRVVVCRRTTVSTG